MAVKVLAGIDLIDISSKQFLNRQKKKIIDIESIFLYFLQIEDCAMILQKGVSLIKRTLSDYAQYIFTKYPIITVTGRQNNPCQAGLSKQTLCQP